MKVENSSLIDKAIQEIVRNLEGQQILNEEPYDRDGVVLSSKIESLIRIPLDHFPIDSLIFPYSRTTTYLLSLVDNSLKISINPPQDNYELFQIYFNFNDKTNYPKPVKCKSIEELSSFTKLWQAILLKELIRSEMSFFFKQMLSCFNHDLNANLGGVSGIAEVLRENEKLDPELLTLLESSSEKAASFTTYSRSFSKVSTTLQSRKLFSLSMAFKGLEVPKEVNLKYENDFSELKTNIPYDLILKPFCSFLASYLDQPLNMNLEILKNDKSEDVYEETLVIDTKVKIADPYFPKYLDFIGKCLNNTPSIHMDKLSGLKTEVAFFIFWAKVIRMNLEYTTENGIIRIKAYGPLTNFLSY